MANTIKNQQDILTKLNIHRLNPMQQEAIAVIETTANTILLSPTGTGKTLGFALPLLKIINIRLQRYSSFDISTYARISHTNRTSHSHDGLRF